MLGSHTESDNYAAAFKHFKNAPALGIRPVALIIAFVTSSNGVEHGETMLCPYHVTACDGA